MATAVKKVAAAAPALLGGVSMNPKDFVQSGLPTDFDGTIVQARTEIWNYDNGDGPKIDDAGNGVFTLGVKLVIKRDEEDESDLVQHYSAGDPSKFAPSIDGVNPAPVMVEKVTDEQGNEVEQETGCSEGYVFVAVADKTGLKNNTNWAHFLECLVNANFPVDQIRPDVRFLEGRRAHFDRIPQKRRAGLASQAPVEGQRAKEILVITRLLDGAAPAPTQSAAPASTKSPSPAPAKASVSATPASTGGGLDEKLQAVVLEALPADGSAIKKGTLSGPVLKSKALAQAEKAAGVKRVVTNEFLEAGMMAEPALWMFDADEGTVARIPE